MEKNKKTIGIIGGMGPQATVELFHRIIQLTNAGKDADHIRILIDNNPKVPDRTKAILSGGKSPVEELQRMALGLQKNGADILAIPCNTSHYFLEDVQKAVTIPIVNMIEATASEMEKERIDKAILLATDGTVKSKIYNKYLEKHGIEVILPDEHFQALVMELIYGCVKANKYNFHIEEFTEELIKLGALNFPVIMGCTEIPIAFDHFNIDSFSTVNPSDILAKKLIKMAGYSLKKEME